MVADIGGTHSRLALFNPRENELRAVQRYNNDEHSSLQTVIATWRETLQEPFPTQACLAIAAPPFNDHISMINRDWTFSLRELKAQFGFSKLAALNDFVAIAHALPYMNPRELQTIQPGVPQNDARPRVTTKLAALGPGTGLGGATLHRQGTTTLVHASEPGHMGLSPQSDLDLALCQALLAQHKRLYAELVLSGPGIERLYRAMADVRGEPASDRNAQEISELALAGDCELCQATLDSFFALLGATAGDYVLANGAYDGLYLAGGIIPKMYPLLASSPFLERFQNKGEMTAHMQRIPVYTITLENPGLLGAAHTPL